MVGIIKDGGFGGASAPLSLSQCLNDIASAVKHLENGGYRYIIERDVEKARHSPAGREDSLNEIDSAVKHLENGYYRHLIETRVAEAHKAAGTKPGYKFPHI